MAFTPENTYADLRIGNRWHPAAVAGGFGVLIFMACMLGILTRPLGYLAALWPANALMLGLLLRYPELARLKTVWAASLLGFMLADAVAGSDFVMSLWLNLSNVFGVAVGWLYLSRRGDTPNLLRRPESALTLLIGTLLASASWALVGCAAGPMYFHFSWQDMMFLSFSSELMSYMLMVPVVLSAPSWTAWRQAESEPAMHSNFWHLAPLAMLVFSELARSSIGGPGSLLFPVPALIWCALTYRLFSTTSILLVLGTWTMASLSMGQFTLTPENYQSVFSLRIGVSLLVLAPLAVACVNIARNDTLAQLDHAVRHDFLTGVLTRRALMNFGTRTLQRMAPDSQRLAVLMADVDHFKQVNDTHGHATGDKLLTEVARRLQEALRPNDAIGRMGGEEFAMILVDVDLYEARAIAERLRESVTLTPVVDTHDKPHLNVTVSIGLAHLSLQAGESNMESMLRKADAAMYSAKSAGRNQVVIADVRH
jgi:diguanylate cyclase (GGDEF)-like protein